MHISPQPQITQSLADQILFAALAALEAHDGAADPHAAAALDMARMAALDASNPLLTMVRQQALQRTLAAAI